MLILRNLSYIHPDKDLLFQNINLNISAGQKVALTGNNGSGKSTLLKIIARELQPAAGEISCAIQPYCVAQHFGRHNHLTVAQALQADIKLQALREILEGNVSETNMNLLNDDWGIEERCSDALAYWGLSDIALSQKLDTLSGGQKTRVFLAGISIHQARFILLDEPSNHLDARSRKQLYDFINNYNGTVLLVSHDRKLLNLPDTVCELSTRGISQYGGNYAFYTEQKQSGIEALNNHIQDKEKALRKVKETERESIERQQKLDARGRKKQEKAGVARIMMNTLRNNAEKSTSRLKQVHNEKIDNIAQELQELRRQLAGNDKMRFSLDMSRLHKDKVLLDARGINFAYTAQKTIWKEALDLQILSTDRLAIKGDNGSGKSTLIQLILGNLEPVTGSIYRAGIRSVYIDQEYTLIHENCTVYEQAQLYNSALLEEHEIKIYLHRFLFGKDAWDKPCKTLSGGERIRLILCCLTLGREAPDLIVLDEPTNNLDIQNIEILGAAIKQYQGALLVVSHDVSFLEEINIEREIML